MEVEELEMRLFVVERESEVARLREEWGWLIASDLMRSWRIGRAFGTTFFWIQPERGALTALPRDS